MDLPTALSRLKPELLPKWETRAFTALGYLGTSCPLDSTILLLILLAAFGPGKIKSPAGTIRVPALGDSAIIKLDGKLYSRFVDRAGKDHGVREVCTVSDLNRGLSWLIKEIDATDLERQGLLNIINSWVARDETALGVHVEKMRSTLPSTER